MTLVKILLIRSVNLYVDRDVLYGVDMARDRAQSFILSKGGQYVRSLKLGLDAIKPNAYLEPERVFTALETIQRLYPTDMRWR